MGGKTQAWKKDHYANVNSASYCLTSFEYKSCPRPLSSSKRQKVAAKINRTESPSNKRAAIPQIKTKVFPHAIVTKPQGISDLHTWQFNLGGGNSTINQYDP